MIEEDKGFTTTHLTPFSFPAFSTFIVPLIVKSRSSLFQEKKRERDAQFFFYVIKQLKNQSMPERHVIATTLSVFVFDI